MRRSSALEFRRARAGSLTFHQPGGAGPRMFVVGSKLGEGGYSTIWKVYERQPDGGLVSYAVKRVLLDASDEEQAAMAEQEISVMESLPPHPNLLALIGSCRRRNKVGRAGLNEVFLLLELCRGGNLASLLIQRVESGRSVTVDQASRTFYDMLLAVAHLHAQPRPLAHRDVKPENFLLCEKDGRWKLADFGSASTQPFDYAASDGGAHAASMEEERVHRFSTPQYRAPEMCDVRSDRIHEKVDIWALGVSLYKILFLQV